jgi:hypothetical protein
LWPILSKIELTQQRKAKKKKNPNRTPKKVNLPLYAVGQLEHIK